MGTAPVGRRAHSVRHEQAGTGAPPGPRGDGAARADSLARPPSPRWHVQLPAPRHCARSPLTPTPASMLTLSEAILPTLARVAPQLPSLCPQTAHPHSCQQVPFPAEMQPPCSTPGPHEDHDTQGTCVRPEVEDKGARVTPGHFLGCWTEWTRLLESDRLAGGGSMSKGLYLPFCPGTYRGTSYRDPELRQVRGLLSGGKGGDLNHYC